MWGGGATAGIQCERGQALSGVPLTTPATPDVVGRILKGVAYFSDPDSPVSSLLLELRPSDEPGSKDRGAVPLGEYPASANVCRVAAVADCSASETGFTFAANRVSGKSKSRRKYQTRMSSRAPWLCKQPADVNSLR